MARRRNILNNISISEDGKTLIFPESVVVIAVNQNDELVFVEQFRQSIGENTLELPGGCVKKGETLINAAKRELVEETGYYIDDLEMILGLDMDFSISNHKTYIFRGQIKDRGNQVENFVVRFLKVDQAIELINNGKITHAQQAGL